MLHHIDQVYLLMQYHLILLHHHRKITYVYSINPLLVA